MRTPSLILIFRKESESEGLGGQKNELIQFVFIYFNSYVRLIGGRGEILVVVMVV